jgi:hypothetical protein
VSHVVFRPDADSLIGAGARPQMVEILALIHADVVSSAPVQQIDPADTVRAERRRNRRSRPFSERIEFKVDDDGTGYVWTRSPLGHIVEFGTKRHTIRVKTRFDWAGQKATGARGFKTTKSLWWYGANFKKYPILSVNHPGQDPNPIFRTAAYKRRGTFGRRG